MAEYFKIGRLVSTFGLKGELILKHHLGKKTALKDLKAIFIEEKKESFIPWFLEAARVRSEEELFLKLEGVDTKEAAVPLTQKEVWLEEADFQKFAARSAPINLLGYAVVEDQQALGTVLEVIEQPHQLLCRIEYRGREAYIPLHEGTLQQIDHRKKRVTVALPPGLLEIYQ